MKDSKVIQHGKTLVTRYGLPPDVITEFITEVIRQARQEVLQEIKKCKTVEDAVKTVKKQMR